MRKSPLKIIGVVNSTPRVREFNERLFILFPFLYKTITNLEKIEVHRNIVSVRIVGELAFKWINCDMNAMISKGDMLRLLGSPVKSRSNYFFQAEKITVVKVKR